MRPYHVFTVAVVAVSFSILMGCSGGVENESVMQSEPGMSKPAPQEAQNTAEEPQIAGNQELCPVMGNPLSHMLYSDYKGKRVFFCCPPCIKAFESDPDKYIKEIEDKGVELAPATQGE